MTTPSDYPIEDCVATASAIKNKMGDKVAIHQKWTCQHCGARQTMEQPDTFYTRGRCEECGKVTVIARCNYVIVAALGEGAVSPTLDTRRGGK